MKVIRKSPIKAGFKPRHVVRAALRGRPHDPNKVVGVEVEVMADKTTDFLDYRKVKEVVLRSIISEPWFCGLEGKVLRKGYGPYENTHPSFGKGWIVRYILD